MKKAFIFLFALVLLLVLAGCDHTPIDPDTDLEKTSAQAEQTGVLSTDQHGTTETFTCDGLLLEVINVQSIRTESMLDDGGNPHEYSVFTCYPDATITVLDAGLSDPAYAADRKAHPQWGLYYTDEAERTRITGETTTVPIVAALEGVYNLEASLFVLTFEFADD